MTRPDFWSITIMADSEDDEQGSQFTAFAGVLQLILRMAIEKTSVLQRAIEKPFQGGRPGKA